MGTQIVDRALEDDHQRTILIAEMNADELHEFIDRYNWDDGFEAVWAVIRNPGCELATALSAFWLSHPDPSSVPPTNGADPEHKRLVTALYTKITAGGFNAGRLSYDPDEFIANRLQRVKLERLGLPRVFFDPLPDPRSDSR